MRIVDSTPKKDGFYMPSELSEHAATYLLWPERPDNWRGGAKPAQKAFRQVVETIAKYEPVVLGVNQSQYLHVLGMNMPNVQVVEISNNDSWIRDTGPTFVVNDKGDMRAVDWAFNGYGGLYNGIYFPWDLDDQIAAKVCAIEGVDRYRTDDFVLEGGSVHSDGEGTLLVTEETCLDKGRNPNLTKEQIEQYLLDYCGAEKVLWLPYGIYKDEDTNGHVDNICQFVAPGKVVLAWEDNEKDPQHERSKKDLEYLESVTDAKGRKLEVIKIHVPNPITITKEESEGVDVVDGTFPRNEGDRLPASYINYYNCNGAIILPIFNDPHDQAAINILQDCFPDRKVEPIYAREILLGGGDIHCITQQVPLA
ncbi:agmatine deiminase [Candidatus Saccharibacteria bacterium]|nr:agmatine deiminase [Candidatus Saccharibacteria bacterium]